jgi:tetratricopeptide (TPR) repeat protein
MKKQIGCLLFTLFLGFPAFSLAANAQDYRDMGQALYQKGLYQKSIGYYKQAVASDPNDWQSYQGMGDDYLALNDNAEALGAYQKSLQINPNNPTVQTQVENLGGSSQVQDQNNYNTLSQDHPNVDQDQPTTIIQQRTIITRRPVQPQKPTYNDNLAPMDHAKFWTRFELGYDYAQQGDLTQGASIYNSQISPNGWSGSVSASTNGYDLGFEVGFLINPYNGLALGLRYMRTDDYTANVNFQPSLGSPDFQDETLSPFVVPLTLDYYLYLPDSGGRFFLTGGIGYYFADVTVNDNFSFTNAGGNADDITGDLMGGAVGFQCGIGRDFALNDTMSLSVYGRFHYAKITNLKGTLSGNYGSDTFGLAKLSDGTIDIDNAGNIGGNSETYATLDFTGFDVGIGLNFYSF